MMANQRRRLSTAVLGLLCGPTPACFSFLWISPAAVLPSSQEEERGGEQIIAGILRSTSALAYLFYSATKHERSFGIWEESV